MTSPEHRRESRFPAPAGERPPVRRNPRTASTARRTRRLCLRQCSEGGRRAGQASARERVRHLPQKRAPQRADFAAQRRVRASPRAKRRKNAQEGMPEARREKLRQSRIRQGFRRRFRHPERTPEPAASGSPGERGWASEERAGAPQNFGQGRGATCVIRRSRASTPLEPGGAPRRMTNISQGALHRRPRGPAEEAPVAGTRPTRSAGRKTGSPDSAPFREQPCGTSLQ